MTDQNHELYPVHHPQLLGDIFDRTAYSVRFESDARRLFSTEDIDISIVSRGGKTKSVDYSPAVSSCVDVVMEHSDVASARIERSSDLDSFLLQVLKRSLWRELLTEFP